MEVLCRGHFPNMVIFLMRTQCIYILRENVVNENIPEAHWVPLSSLEVAQLESLNYKPFPQKNNAIKCYVNHTHWWEDGCYYQWTVEDWIKTWRKSSNYGEPLRCCRMYVSNYVGKNPGLRFFRFVTFSPNHDSLPHCLLIVIHIFPPVGVF